MGRDGRWAPGDTVGAFTLIGHTEDDEKRVMWDARCECGSKVSINAHKVAKAEEQGRRVTCAKCRAKARRAHQNEPRKCVGCGETRRKKFPKGARTLCTRCTQAKARNGVCDDCGKPLRHSRIWPYQLVCPCKEATDARPALRK